MDYKIRKMIKEDSKAVSHVVTVAWNETYPGIVPDDFLKLLIENEDLRAEKTYNHFDEDKDETLVLEIDNEIVGFVKYGESNDEEYRGSGEIFALYILKKYHGLGLGRKLVNEAINELKKQGYKTMLIGCLKGNPTNEFYKHIGGKYIKDGIFKRLNIKENIYYFDNLDENGNEHNEGKTK